MPNTDLNKKHARLIEDDFGVRRGVAAFGIAGMLSRTTTAERVPGSLSAFPNASQGVSTRSSSRQPISSPTGFATNPSTKPARAMPPGLSAPCHPR